MTDNVEIHPLSITDDVNISSSIDCPLLELESSMDINKLLNNEINNTCEQPETEITNAAQQPEINDIASTFIQSDIINSESIELLLLQDVLFDGVTDTSENVDILSQVVTDSLLQTNKNDEDLCSTINFDDLPFQVNEFFFFCFFF